MNEKFEKSYHLKINNGRIITTLAVYDLGFKLQAPPAGFSAMPPSAPFPLSC